MHSHSIRFQADHKLVKKSILGREDFNGNNESNVHRGRLRVKLSTYIFSLIPAPNLAALDMENTSREERKSRTAGT